VRLSNRGHFRWQATWISCLCIWATTALPVPADDRTGSCVRAPIGAGLAQAVIDGRTFLLADGREVRLAGIEVPGPRASDAAAPPYDWEAARAALQALIGGTEVVFKGNAPSHDRYGRVIADVFTGPSAEQSVAQTLLAAGHAWMSPHVDPACVHEYLTSERAARAAKLGLWSDPYYEIKNVENAADILAWQGRFALVEGKVVSVRDSGGTTYVNFGRRWTEDFTAIIPKRTERFLVSGMEPRKLQGRRIRLRGWIEKYGGPTMELARPEQVELVEEN
jgi:endonuclease YncB( thermonuclease family)